MTRVECERLHVALVCRFVYNCLHFGRQVQSMVAMLAPEPPDAPVPASAVHLVTSGPVASAQQCYRPIIEVGCIACLGHSSNLMHARCLPSCSCQCSMPTEACRVWE